MESPWAFEVFRPYNLDLVAPVAAIEVLGPQYYTCHGFGDLITIMLGVLGSSARCIDTGRCRNHPGRLGFDPTHSRRADIILAAVSNGYKEGANELGV